MLREACVTSLSLRRYVEEPNLFWCAFEKQYRRMFRPLHSLIQDEQIQDWFVSPDATLNPLIDFVSAPSYDLPGLLILRGWTGSGKTTSVRVLFEKLKDRLPKPTVYLYIETSVAALTADSMEREFDVQIHAHLKEQFGDDHFSNVSPDDESDGANKARLNQLLNEGKNIVVVWDNIDQCPRQMQLEALRLAHHKLYWIKQEKIIVPVREYNFSLAERELPIAAYDYTVIRQVPPDINEIIQRRGNLARRATEQLDKQTKIQLGGGISVTVADGNKFLNKVINDLSHPDVTKALMELSNFNLSMQLKMARYAFQSPYFTRDILLHAISVYYEQDPTFVLIPIHRFIEGILTGSQTCPYCVFSFEESLLINMFNAGQPHAYYNILNRHHVAQIALENEGGTEVESIISELENLGHP